MSKSLFERALSAEGITGQLADVARSIYQQESGSGKNTKTSNAGAHGGMQIIPSTFKSVADKGWDIKDPMQNARAGIRYLKQLDKQSGGDPVLTAAGYYGGPGGMEKARRGIAVSDPRNPNAPTTLEYGKQVAARLPGAKEQTTPKSILAMPDDEMPQLADIPMAQAPVAAQPVRVAAAQVPVQATPQAIPAVNTPTGMVQQVAAAPVTPESNQWAALKNAMAMQSMQPADLNFGGRKVAPQQMVQADMGEMPGVDPREILRKFGLSMYAQDQGRYQASLPEFVRTEEYTG